MKRGFLFFLSAVFIFSCSTGKLEEKPFDFSSARKKLAPLHQEMGPVQGGDWLAYHEEKNISFEAYKKIKLVRPTVARNKIYLQPLGDFDASEKELLNSTAAYLKAFYGLEVHMLPVLSDKVIPKSSRRMSCEVRYDVMDGQLVPRPDSSLEQLHTQYILHKILKPALPQDAAVMIALCDKDLYPEASWNFVFGQALLKYRVGVWSFYRFGDVHNEKEFPIVLKRTLKTASHETGHMFSIKHCSTYKCIMNGSNHLEEADRKPTYFCPDCLEKFCWNMGQGPSEQFERLHRFWNDMNDTIEVKNYNRFLKALK